MDEPIHIVGAGGIGCAVGLALRAEGVRVVFVDADHAKVRWGRERGVGIERFETRPAEFEAFEEWAPAPGSTVLLCTKCYDNAAVLKKLPASVTLFPIQNGFDGALANEQEGIASFVSECGPRRSETRITRAGRLHLGPRGQAVGTAALDWLHDRLARSRVFRSLRIRVERVADILPFKYTKLMYNAAISPLAAAAGLDNGDLLWLPTARRLFFELLRENYAILAGAGIPLGKIGPFHPDTVQHILRRPSVARALAWAFYPTLKGSYCSMSGDLPAGRTEIEYYNRHLIDLAGTRPCPLNRRVYDLIKRMERERIPPGVKMLEKLG